MSFKNLLVPVDFSETSLHALRLAVQLARVNKSRITLLHVGVVPTAGSYDAWGWTIPPSDVLYKWHEEMAAEQLHTLRRVAGQEIPDDIEWRVETRDGFAPEEILAAAKADSHDLIVIGTHGRTGIERVVMGSVAERVIRLSPVPVLTTR